MKQMTFWAPKVTYQNWWPYVMGKYNYKHKPPIKHFYATLNSQ
jgi:hypothetical protein